ncbi:MAG TPA: SxtJ family membrane protein [Flavitalea sp.]|nr:SxtJ family membrane protein [Flavitalea sp.]
MKKDNHKSTETILVLVLALGAMYWIFEAPAFLLSAAALGVAGLFLPAFADIVHRLWYKLAHALGFVMGRILLTLIFFVALVPLALLSRMFGRNSLALKPGAPSYFKTREHTYSREDLEKTW